MRERDSDAAEHGRHVLLALEDDLDDGLVVAVGVDVADGLREVADAFDVLELGDARCDVVDGAVDAEGVGVG